ncbi:hypothetical protein MNB_SV-13-1695 [hydrothermal vent metagenome]|uniref:DUF58 domain-containing protein n=1 Tax=hydrothermal vent metagenome TaxID=652676 RepID=A0A1W1CZ11_9ZZZZ
MYFAKGNAKQKKLSEVAMILGYLVEYNSDLFTGIAYTQTQTLYTPASKQRYAIESFAQSLYDAPLLHSKLSFSLAIQDLFVRLSKPSLLFILGDFMEEIDLSLLAQKHKIIAIIIREREEEFPKYLGEKNLKNPENKEVIQSYFGKKSMQYYLNKLQSHEGKRQKHFQKYGIKSIKIFCDEDIVQKLIQGLKQ